MPWPTPQDYNEAVQNPQIAFTDADLRLGQPELTQLGLPRPRSGNFACVYKIQGRGQPWAARCFLKEVPDLQRRYEAISQYLNSANLTYTVPFTYISNGISLRGRSYPLLKMQWVKGESLNSFVGKTLLYPATLLSLARVLLKIMADLRAVNIAHGDLQHDNILVVGDQLCLIDYDGMFVPALAGNQSNELGHRNYQLPSRSAWDYAPYLDNFSAWVIYVSLAALAVHPELWNAYRGGDQCLIFRREDFVKPQSSAILRDLNSSRNDQLRFLVDLFAGLFFLSPQDVPALDGNLPEIKVEPIKQWWGDFVESTSKQEKEEPQTAKPEEHHVAVDPGWIIDSLEADSPVERVAFQSKPKQLRIVLVTSLVGVFLTRLFIEMPPSEVLLWASCVFGLDVLLCVARWSSDPSRVDFKLFKKESKVLLRRVRQHQALIDSIRAERFTVQEELAKTDRKLQQQKERVLESLQGELGKNQAELDAQLTAVNQRRQQTRAAETASLNSFQATLGNQISELDRKIAAINQREADDIARAVSALRDAFIQAFLRSRSVSGSIPGIGSTYKSSLVAAGFITAADISWNVRRVYGIGPGRQAALMAWRKNLESQAIAAAPTISPLERSAIQARYRQDRQNLEMERQRLQAQLSAQIASTRQHFASLQQPLNQEEQRTRTANTQKKDRISADYQSRIVTVELELVAAQKRVAPTLNDLSEKLRAAQKQSFALKWQAAKHSSDGRRFAALRFRDYVSKIILP
jgi:anion-transporting  ArsA/GET3 family ATPase